MNYLPIPGSDLTPSQLCLGTNRFGTVISKTDSFTLLDGFSSQGGNFVDTAHIYADWISGVPKSASEKTLGAWIKERGNRDNVILATKGAHPHLESMHVPRMSAVEIGQDVEESLRHLQTDMIDLYWLHRDDPKRDVGAILETMNDLVQAGKIRYFGCSNWSVSRMRLAANYALEHGISGFVASQPMWSLAVPNRGRGMLSDPSLQVVDQSAWDYHYQNKMAVVPYSSQARGYFSKMADGGLDSLSTDDRDLFDHVENRAISQRVQDVATAYSTGPAQIVLGYLLSQPFPVFPVIGCRTPEQLDTSLQATQLSLSFDDIVFLAGSTMKLQPDAVAME